MPQITACIICKNEEIYIESCLSALQSFGIPIVVTDTGSTDRTVAIIKSVLTQQDKLCHFTWCDDFSAAKNYCAMQANSDWIWMIDADEIICDCIVDEIFSFVQNPENQNKIGTISLKNTFYLQGTETFSIAKLGRIYNQNHYHYEGTIHEQLTIGNTSDFVSGKPDIHSSHAITESISSDRYILLPATFNHMGYGTPEILKRKCKRNIALLEKEYHKEKEPYLAYQLGNAYATLEEHETAITYFEEGLSFDLDPSLQYVRSMVEAYGYSLLALKRNQQALSFQGIYDTFAVTADFVFLMGLIYMNNAMFEEAISEFDKATTFPNCSVEGTNSFRALYNKGVILECTGKIAEAIDSYKQCQHFTPAIQRLNILCPSTTK